MKKAVKLTLIVILGIVILFGGYIFYITKIAAPLNFEIDLDAENLEKNMVNIPVFKAKDFEENIISLSDTLASGKIVVLNFWGTWCGPCVKEIPDMNKVVAKFKTKPITFIAINLDDDKDDAIQYLKRKPFFYHHVFQKDVVGVEDVWQFYSSNINVTYDLPMNKDQKIAPMHIIILPNKSVWLYLRGGVNEWLLTEKLNEALERI